jgi:hypothetical protein
MSRRKRRSAKPKPAVPAPPVAEPPPAAAPLPPKPRRWFLATMIVLEAAWLLFLVALILRLPGFTVTSI